MEKKIFLDIFFLIFDLNFNEIPTSLLSSDLLVCHYSTHSCHYYKKSGIRSRKMRRSMIVSRLLKKWNFFPWFFHRNLLGPSRVITQDHWEHLNWSKGAPFGPLKNMRILAKIFFWILFCWGNRHFSADFGPEYLKLTGQMAKKIGHTPKHQLIS